MAKRPKSKASTPQSRTTGGRRYPGDPPGVLRDEYGRVKAGTGSLNPGGLSRAIAEARRAALWHTPRAIAKAGELLEHKNPFVVGNSINTILARGLGKESPPMELPGDEPPKGAQDTSPHALVSRLLLVLERDIARLEALVNAGVPLPESSLAGLSERAKTLAALREEERRLKQEGPGANLSDAELLSKTLEALTEAQLQQELTRRKVATP